MKVSLLDKKELCCLMFTCGAIIMAGYFGGNALTMGMILQQKFTDNCERDGGVMESDGCHMSLKCENCVTGLSGMHNYTINDEATIEWDREGLSDIAVVKNICADGYVYFHSDEFRGCIKA